MISPAAPEKPFTLAIGPWQITLSAVVLPEGAPPRRTLKRLWIGLLLSILIHATLVAILPKREFDMSTPAAASKPLSVELAPRRASLADAAPPPTPSVPNVTPPRRTIAVAKSSPTMPVVPFVPEPPPVPPRDPRPVPPEQDFMAAVEARRAQRRALENTAATENAAARAREGDPNGDPNAKANAAIARNIETLSQKKDGTSGVFQILNVGHREAQFAFRGWTVSRESSWKEVINVETELGGDIGIAVIRRMIKLIREHYPGDFNWDSRKEGRVVLLSARPQDNAALEKFMKREFEDQLPYRN